MYELLLKWGLDSLSKFSGIKGEHELSILLEAVKTKNALIVERYRQCWAQNERLIDLVVEVESTLTKFVEKTEETDGTWKSARLFIGKLRADFHPEYYRRLEKIRTTFEGTNDLLSAYSYAFLKLVNIDTLTVACKDKKIYSRGDICRLYRGVWTRYSEVISAILRVTSGDLRFWVTDVPYVAHADNWAQGDLGQAIKLITPKAWSGQRFHLSLEHRRGLDRFWHELQEHHLANIEAAGKREDKAESQSDG